MASLLSPPNRKNQKHRSGMFAIRLVLFLWACVLCRAVPDGYILDVSQDCGSLFPGDFDATGASLTIKSDLLVSAVLRCEGGIEVAMDPINDTNIESTKQLYYTGDNNGTIGSTTDCFFSHPHPESNMYVVELDIYWGYGEDSLLNEMEVYTITCTVEGKAQDTVHGRTIIDGAIPPRENLKGNLGSAFTGDKALKLVDVLGNEIKTGHIPMSKKVKLELSVTGGSAMGLTPYDCIAYNSDGSIIYHLLNAGCGDGVIFPKDEGFSTSSTSAFSPYFKVFKLIETLHNSPQISYTCEFAVCATECDGNSCALRQKRSTDTSVQVNASVMAPFYKLENMDELLRQKEMEAIKLRSRLTPSTVAIFGIGGIAVLSLLIAMSSCVVKGSKSSEKNLRRYK